jgi:outer membrane lipoprotein-sorting protein
MKDLLMITNIQRSNNHQNTFGKTYLYDLEKKSRVILSEAEEKSHISGLLDKAKNGDFNLTNEYFFNKTFKSKDGDTFEMKPHTVAFYAASEFHSADKKSRIVTVKDKDMNKENSSLYNTLAKALGIIADKD